MSLVLNHRYQVIDSLGKGGFGETFLAVDTHMPSARKCVIKQLKPAVQSPIIPDWLKERFAKEAAILEELGEKHPQIPTLYAYFSDGGDFYLVQEWIEGETLTQIHQRQGNLSENQIKEIFIGILPILDYVHSRYIIHRDIKPDNIIIRSVDKKPVLIDFGIVKETVATMIHSNGNTPYSVALGTPGYMASEQAAGRPLNSSDLYSLGLTAVFLLTGQTPQYLASDPNTGEILWRKEAPKINSNLGTVIDRAIRFHPRDRFSTAAEMLQALEADNTIATSATMAVLPHNLSQKTTGSSHTTTLNPEEAETQVPWALLTLGAFLAASAIIGGLVLGVMLGNKQRSQPIPSPSISPEVSPPETNPSPELSQPKPKPRPPAQPPRRPQPKPQPSSTPKAKPSPLPEATPKPIPEAKPSPQPKPQPSPTPEAKPSPLPEATPKPIPEPTQVIPIPVEPPPQVSQPQQPTNEPSPVNPKPSPINEAENKEEDPNQYNIQKYFESDTDKKESSIKQYFDSDRP